MNMTTAHIFGKCRFNVQSQAWIGCVDCGALSSSVYAALLIKRENPEEPGGCPIH